MRDEEGCMCLNNVSVHILSNKRPFSLSLSIHISITKICGFTSRSVSFPLAVFADVNRNIRKMHSHFIVCRRVCFLLSQSIMLLELTRNKLNLNVSFPTHRQSISFVLFSRCKSSRFSRRCFAVGHWVIRKLCSFLYHIVVIDAWFSFLHDHREIDSRRCSVKAPRSMSVWRTQCKLFRSRHLERMIYTCWNFLIKRTFLHTGSAVDLTRLCIASINALSMLKLTCLVK